MKSYISIGIIFLSLTLGAQCPTNWDTFTSQSQLDAFLVNFPDCKEISDEIKIEGIDIVNLNGLSQLNKTGSLIIGYTSIENVSGLKNLTHISGDVTIEYNSMLSSIQSLNKLEEIKGSLEVESNALSQWPNFENLSVLGGLSINKEHQIEEIDGFNVLTEVDNSIEILTCDSLKSIMGFDQLKRIGEDLLLEELNVNTIDGFDQLTTIEDDLRFFRLYQIKEVTGFDSLQVVGSIAFNTLTSLEKLQGFNEIENIPKGLGISTCRKLKDIDVLNNLKSVGQTVTLRNVVLNFDREFLGNLSSIGGDLLITDNELSGDLSFKALETIGESLEIQRTTGQDPFFNFEKLSSVGEWLRLSYNTTDFRMAFDSLLSVGLDVEISFNQNLGEVSGFNNLLEHSRNIDFVGNDSLKTVMGFNALQIIEGDLNFRMSDVLEEVSGFSNLLEVEQLRINSCNALSCLRGFNALSTITEYLEIDFTQLEDLNDFANLKSIAGVLEIRDCKVLENIDSLANVDIKEVGSLRIRSNNILKMCSVESICNYLRNDWGEHDIKFNDEGCDDKFEILENCAPSTKVEDWNVGTNIFPNPTSNVLKSQTLLSGNYSIVSSSGKQVDRGILQRQEINVSHLEVGLYFLIISKGNKSRYHRFIKTQ